MIKVLSSILCLFACSFDVVFAAQGTAPGKTLPSGSSGSIQYNNSGVFGGTTSIRITGSTIDFYPDGQKRVSISTNSSEGTQILVAAPTVSETPNIASLTNPLMGFLVTSGDSAWIYNRSQFVTFRRSGTDGLGHIMFNGFGKKDSDAYEPMLQNEQSGSDKDGITWIDNRLPDGVNGHDANGRFVVIGVAGINNLRVGSEGVAIGTTTVSGSTLTVHGVLTVSTGSVRLPVGSASKIVFTSTLSATTGIYFPASGSMSVGHNGNESVRFYDSGTYRQTHFYSSGDGSKPPISFPTYTGTGIGNSANTLNFFNAGSIQFAMTSGSRFQGSWNSTTASDPAIQNLLDSNTGIFWPAADNLGFSTNGTENFRLTTSGTLKTTAANESTASGSAALGANCPASTVSAPYTWIKMISSDGSTVYVPAWK